MKAVLDGGPDLMPAFIREALGSLRPVPSPDPRAWAAARGAFLAEAREFSAAAAIGAPVARRGFWKRSLGSLSSRRWGRVPATAVVSLVVVVALLLGATVGTVSAAQASLPGSWLHPLKLRLEDLRLARAGDPKTAVQRAMAITRARVEEVQRLVEAGRSVPPEVARRYQEHLTLAFGMAESLPAASRAATLTQIEAEVTTQLTSVEEAAEQGPDEDVAAARQMVEAMRQALGRDPEDGELGGEAQPTMTPTPQPETPTRTPDTGTGRVTATPTQDPTGTSVRPMPTPTSSPGSEGNAIQVTPTATTEGGSWEARPTPTPKPTTGDGGPQVTAPQATPPRVTRPRATAPPTPAGVNWQPSPASTPKPGTRDGVP